jgi:DNA polymerase
MAAGLHNGIIRNSLKVLAPLYGVGTKDDTSLQSTKGLFEIPPEWRPAFAKYNTEDNEQCHAIFLKQLPNYPRRELEVIDLVIRMFCDSHLYVNIELAREGLAAEMMARRSEILKSGATEDELLSNDKFAAALERYIPCPTKISPVTHKVAWALAQTDEEFVVLQDHEDKRVALLVRGRLAAKSTQAETRAYRLIEAGKDGQRLPVGYTYSAALTHRFGGTNKLNLTNLARVDKKNPKPSDALRHSIIAPPGHVIVVSDSAQIEARVLAWLCGQKDVLELFRTGQDVYRNFAAIIYNKPAEEIDTLSRFIAKKCILGLGFGTGHKKLQTTLALGIDGPEVIISLTEAKRLVTIYRNRNDKIVRGWQEAERMLRQMQAGNEGTAFNGVLEYDKTTIWLPNGMPMHYYHIESDDTGNMSYFTVRGRKKIYGAKLAENLTQALARIIVIGEQMVDIKNWLPSLKLRKNEIACVNMTTYDEVVAVVPERHADKTLKNMIEIMKTPPAWCKDIPLNAEGGFDVKYSK